MNAGNRFIFLEGKRSYPMWRLQMIKALKQEGFWSVVNGSLPQPKTYSERWTELNDMANGLINLSTSDDIMMDMSEYEIAKELWEQLQSKYGSVLICDHCKEEGHTQEECKPLVACTHCEYNDNDSATIYPEDTQTSEGYSKAEMLLVEVASQVNCLQDAMQEKSREDICIKLCARYMHATWFSR
ncbi:hypothetical protein O6H91_10G076900 [Diphasiastrum complanatum]|uniref:Uncharacterized protein n=1 Tax=Diphasiastrum complanatum TaxID=34168 RepID=A0ACC2CIG7_DIPCM|nr:hypothetical protein O6H91_10G076900 [Diphasiastrum complanatum]